MIAANHDENEDDTDEEPKNFCLPVVSFKLEPSIRFDGMDETFGVPSTGRFENDDDNDTRGNDDTDENMETENDGTTSDNDMENSGGEDDVNVSDVNNSFQYLSYGFNKLYQKNAKLEKRLRTAIDETNKKLMAENEQLKIEMQNQIEMLQKAHELEMTQLKEEHQRLVENGKQAVERCKQECIQLVEHAKGNKYCYRCGVAKPLDIFLCDKDCRKERR